MEDFELTLFDRIEVIKSTAEKYDLENNSYLAFSGGKDSTILHYLLDEALPNNRIPRVYIDTGIEYDAIKKFVNGLAEKDERFVIVKPTLPIVPTLKKYGYPFKSKLHSNELMIYQNHKDEIKAVLMEGKEAIAKRIKNGERFLGIAVAKYYFGLNNKGENAEFYKCPDVLKFQFTEETKVKYSNKCCLKMKKEPFARYQKETGRSIAMTGMRKEEGGAREGMGCIVTSKDGKLEKFHPLAVVTKDFEKWYEEARGIRFAELYYPPYNYKRTGCKGCPYALDLQKNLDTMSEIDRKQCEVIWKPVYDEYRKLNYRLRNAIQLTIL